MTYDSKINFYNINGAKLSQPQQMTVGDVHDMFVPLADGLFTSLDESEAVIDSLMEQIPQMFADTRETETVLGPVIQAGKEAFKVTIFIFCSNLKRNLPRTRFMLCAVLTWIAFVIYLYLNF